MDAMTARRLLDLTLEYQQAVEARHPRWQEFGGTATGRDPEEIAQDVAALFGPQGQSAGGPNGETLHG